MEPLLRWYRALESAYGDPGWWPAETRFEVIVGAVLTQNTSWKNVEAAIENLRRARVLSPAGILSVPPARLARLLRPSGYFRQKTRKLRGFVHHVETVWDGDLDAFLDRPARELRPELLSLWGIGPETADSIVLYAAHRPVFVVDAYTIRIARRHGVLPAGATYEQAQSLFTGSLPRSTRVFNRYHAYLVQVGKLHCRRAAPDCAACPLRGFLPTGGPVREP